VNLAEQQKIGLPRLQRREQLLNRLRTALRPYDVVVAELERRSWTYWAGNEVERDLAAFEELVNGVEGKAE